MFWRGRLETRKVKPLVATCHQGQASWPQLLLAVSQTATAADVTMVRLERCSCSQVVGTGQAAVMIGRVIALAASGMAVTDIGSVRERRAKKKKKKKKNNLVSNVLCMRKKSFHEVRPLAGLLALCIVCIKAKARTHTPRSFPLCSFSLPASFPCCILPAALLLCL